MSLVLLLLLLCPLYRSDPIPVDGDKQLQLVHAIWRHGDRSPTTTCASDPLQEDSWTFGGGGWGQLSPKGMEQHVSLGLKLRIRYAGKFLSDRYKAGEVYIRSTDVNRTLISALSNMIGMYGQGSAKAGDWGDIPDLTGNADYKWPTGFVPIPVHTVDDDYDYLGNPDMICPRQDALWKLAQEAPELQRSTNANETQQVLRILKDNCNKTYNYADIWEVIDAFFIEKTYNLTVPKFVTDDLYEKLTTLNDQAQDYVNGIGIAPYRGVDLSTEIKRIRGGSLLNSVYDHLKRKLSCINGTECSKWMHGLKYYVYSAHDTTVYAYLTALNASKAVVKPEGYPHYAAAVLTELWTDKNGEPFVKFLYHNGFHDNFSVITSSVSGCEQFAVYCPLQKFAALADSLSFKKWGSPEAMCADINILPPTSATTSYGLSASLLVLLISRMVV